MPQQTWAGETLGGRYKVEELLGKGGMSAVYKATDPNLRRVVAIKLIHPHLSDNPDFVTRFKEEAAAVAQLRHPNIVQVYDFNNEGDNFYMVMEFVPGETLQARLKRLNTAGRHMDLTEMLKYGINLCDAVDYAHKRNLIHRDIKPANLMLDVQGQAILMDFGISKIIGGQYHTATGATIGTALYMAPEQIKGERVDERADIYSIGVTLFEMVSGRPPFEADSAMTTMMMHLNDPVPDLRQIEPDTSPELVAIIEKALAKDRNQRFASAAEMSIALRKILDRMYSAAAGATLMSEPPQPEAAMAAAALDATLKAANPESAALAAAAYQAAESASPPAGVTVKAESYKAVVQPAPVTRSAGQPSAQDAAVPIAAGAVMAGAGQEGSPPPPVPAVQTGATGDVPPKKRSLSPAMLAGGAATILILLVILFVAGRGLLNPDTDLPATDTPATLAAAAPATAVATNTALPTATSNPPTSTPAPTAIYVTPATPTATTAPTDTPSTEPYVEITGITLQKDAYGQASNYVIDYKTENFTESRTGYHIHFFFDTVPPDQAGKPGYGPWKLYYGPSPFKGLTVQDRPSNAMQICALVANADHSLYYPTSGQLTTGNCWNIPIN